MVSSILNNLPNPNYLGQHRVNYIGHGQLESSSESLSALHVISHELGHAQEFKREAMRNGSEIRSLDVKIHYEMRNGKMVAVSGETSALTASKVAEQASLQPYTDDGNGKKDLQLSNTNLSQLNTKRINEIEKKEELENKIKSIEDSLKKENPFVYSAKEKDEIAPVSTEKDFYKEEMVREKKRLEEEIRLLKMQEETRKTFAMLTDIQRSMLANVFGMMQIATDTKSGGLEAFA